ncbi:MAG: hypothetical protein ACI9NY_001249 [Kiritimatiellia bacterium]|jgi:hypothetical protein
MGLVIVCYCFLCTLEHMLKCSEVQPFNEWEGYGQSGR